MKYPAQKWKVIKVRRRRNRRRLRSVPRVVVPGFFTLMNLFCGFLSIVAVADGNLILGAWLIVLAGMFDSLDGVVARLANATSSFGTELDSLSDIVSFGVAPGFLILHFGLHEMSVAGIIISALPPLCGSVRLARFNVAAVDRTYEDFRGLPIPVQAVILAAFVLTFIHTPELFEGLQYGVATVLVPLVVILSFLMLSTIPFDKLPSFNKESFKYRKPRFLLFLFYLTMIILFQEYGLIFVFSIYILKGLITGAWLFWNEQFGEESGYSIEDDYGARQGRDL